MRQLDDRDALSLRIELFSLPPQRAFPIYATFGPILMEVAIESSPDSVATVAAIRAIIAEETRLTPGASLRPR